MMNVDSGIKYPHAISVMIKEHETILGFLEKIEQNNLSIQQNSSFEESWENISSIARFITLIIEDELHHQREEKVIFVYLEQKGVINPTKILRWEHHEIRSLKYDIKKLLDNINHNNFNESKKELKKLVFMLDSVLKEHVLKEENYLYPLFIESFTDQNVLKKVEEECDRIGYCSFKIS